MVNRKKFDKVDCIHKGKKGRLIVYLVFLESSMNVCISNLNLLCLAYWTSLCSVSVADDSDGEVGLYFQIAKKQCSYVSRSPCIISIHELSNISLVSGSGLVSSFGFSR